MALIMNNNDIKLIGIILVIIIIIFILFNINKNKGNTVLVYYDNKIILEKNLNIDSKYVVDGYLGEVEIEVKDRKVRVIKENSPKHICSREGYIKDSSKPLICLPNKIIIKITDKESNIDGVVY